MKAQKQIIVKQNDDAPIAAEIIAASIVQIADGINALRSGPLNDRALFLLIQNASSLFSSGSVGSRRRVTIGEIEAVFEGIAALKETYLKKPTKRSAE